jgi:hypothetical protein
MKRFALMIAALLLVGCAGQLEEVEIVEVVEDHQLGAADSYTVVEFPDGERRYRPRTWGEAGDRFPARKASGGQWK